MSLAYNTYKLGEVISLVGGGTPSKDKEEYWGSDIPWATVKDLKSSSLNKTQDSITALGLDSSASKIVKSGSIVIATRMAVGRIAMTGIDVAINQDLKGITCSNKIHIRYLYYFLFSQENYFNKVSSGATVKGIKIGHITDMEISLPPLAEQHKIAAILDAADQLRQKDRQLIDHYATLSQSLFLEMFGDPVTNPMGWDKYQIGKICTNIIDCVNKTAPIADACTEYKMIRTTNIRNYKVDLSTVRYVEKETYEKWIRRLTPRRGDVIFTREAPVGEAGILETDDLVFLGQRTIEYRTNINIANPWYLLYELMGSNIKRQVKKLSAGSTVKHLSVPDCQKFQVNVPPVTLQNQFAQHIQAIEQQKQQAQASLEKSEDLFNSLLQRAFKGELTGSRAA